MDSAILGYIGPPKISRRSPVNPSGRERHINQPEKRDYSSPPAHRSRSARKVTQYFEVIDNKSKQLDDYALPCEIQERRCLLPLPQTTLVACSRLACGAHFPFTSHGGLLLTPFCPPTILENHLLSWIEN